jgi:hypothetical protein
MPLKVVAAMALALLPIVLDAGQTLPPPADTVAVTLGGQTQMVWPYATEGKRYPAPWDPINLVFLGTDPRQVRQALLGLDGNRAPVFPPIPPFDCTWADAMGYEMMAWAEAEDWVGSEIQLSCGPGAMGPVRFHLRLFHQGANTLGAAHFEVLIPKTAEHEVLHWELAEQLVALDMQRTGTLTSVPDAVRLQAAGSWRTILKEVYNSLLGVPEMALLLGLIGMPTQPQTANVPLPNDGLAPVFSADIVLEPAAATFSDEITLHYDRPVPRPFCSAGPSDVVYLKGPVTLKLRTHTTPSGNFSRTYVVAGLLDVTPINPATGVPTGPTVPAVVTEAHGSLLTDHYGETREFALQSLLGSPSQSLSWTLWAGHSDRHHLSEQCGTPTP